MKIVVQKVKSAKVHFNNEEITSINEGLVLLVGFTQGDTVKEIDYLINKVINLRIFEDENDVMNLSALDENKEILSLSQFTLYANTKKGNRPSYTDALNSKDAKVLFNLFNEKLSSKIKTKVGLFGEDIQIELINDGPTTIILEENNL